MRTECMAQVVVCLPSNGETISSIQCNTKRKREERELGIVAQA
jgi:hypothetical protein